MPYDVLVIGGGPGGEHLLGALSGHGLKLGIVERELVGGECSYWACIPSKTLLRPGEARAAADEAPGVSGAAIDATEVLAYRDFMVSDHTDGGQVSWLESIGAELIRGSGRLDGPGRVRVGEDVHEARHIVLATGSDPNFPPIGPLDGAWTNREATGAKEVPRRLLVLGTGPVGSELAQAFRRLGSEVVLVGRAQRLLPREAAVAGETLAGALRAEGIELRLGADAKAARRDGEDWVLTLGDGEELRGDRLLVATGRRPRTDVGLDTIGLDPDVKAIPIDERCAVADGVWALGDCTGAALFTHVSKYHARVIADNILGRARRADLAAVPRVVFTDPQVAAVGHADGERSATVQLSAVARTATYTTQYAQRPGSLTLWASGDHLTGACAIGPEAGEWLGWATLAVKTKTPIATLLDTIQPFPTFCEAYLDALREL